MHFSIKASSIRGTTLYKIALIFFSHGTSPDGILGEGGGKLEKLYTPRTALALASALA